MEHVISIFITVLELVPNMNSKGNWAQLSFPIEAHGFGAVLQIVREPDFVCHAIHGEK